MGLKGHSGNRDKGKDLKERKGGVFDQNILHAYIVIK